MVVGMCRLMWNKLTFAVLLFFSVVCQAIDNPEVPDLTAEFQTRADIFEQTINHQAQNQSEIDTAYREYSKFLDQELNTVYTALVMQLSDDSKQALIRSQRLWLQFRDAEFGFIDKNWTLLQFGSSSAISRSAYRTSIAKHRVIELLDYAKNYREIRK